MPSSGSVASELIIRGTISTSPPILIATTISTIIRLRLFSIVSWRIAVPLLLRRVQYRNGYRFLVAYGLPDVVSHDEHAREEQQAAKQSEVVVGLDCLERFDERIRQGAVGIYGAPHQAFGHTGDPHRDGVQYDTNRRCPEMYVDELCRVHPFTVVEAWQQ